MDFNELLNVADHNKNEASVGASVKRYSSQLPPPKKITKSGVQSEGIKKFLEKKKAEEEAKAAAAQRQKEQLLAIRAQNSKNNKKAKIMASRTKDNDFSRIKLTDDEIEAKKKREAELIRKNLDDKVERMKARIEMEEKEALLPKKRRRKNKNGEYIEDRVPEERRPRRDNYDPEKEQEKSISEKKNQNQNIYKRPPPPVMNFNELLKIAEKKKNEPLEIVIPKKMNEKLLSKKERKLLEEERLRERRKQERLLQGDLSKPLGKKTPVVIHVEKDSAKPAPDSKFKSPKGTPNIPSSKNEHVKDSYSKISSVESSNKKPSVSLPEKHVKSNTMLEQKKIDRSRDEMTGLIKNTVQKKSFVKINPVSTAPPKLTLPTPQIDTEALSAAIEKRIREKLEKEMEERIAAKFAAKYGLNGSDMPTVKDGGIPKQNVINKESINNGMKKMPERPAGKLSREQFERMVAFKKREMEQKRLTSRVPEKKPFHKNPYLDPPRRLLEPQIHRPPPKRRIESSDDEEEEDDMSDFIDDGPSTQNDDNYSEYIKEIFGYDKNNYMDYDDDDIMESSFAQQMKEEMESARAGAREDLEEERKELERRKRKKLKK